jgi:hypothetical protein
MGSQTGIPKNGIKIVQLGSKHIADLKAEALAAGRVLLITVLISPELGAAHGSG